MKTGISFRQFFIVGASFVVGFSLSNIINNTKIGNSEDDFFGQVFDNPPISIDNKSSSITSSSVIDPNEHGADRTSDGNAVASEKIEVEQPSSPKDETHEEKIVELSSDPDSGIKEKKEAPPKDVCSAIKSSFSFSKTTSAVGIWRENLVDVKWITRYLDGGFVFHDFYARMMHYLTPQRLQSSVKTLPFNQWDKVGEILDIAFQRYQYEQNKKQGKETPGEVPRKVRILIMGGSVTAGVYCVQNPVLGRPLQQHRRTCRWGARLVPFLDLLFPGVVQVDVAAYGGTNTRGGTTVWEYDLFPKGVQSPDILINAFATNDMHVHSMAEAMSNNMTLEEGILQMNQEFVRKVMKPRSNCDDRSPPLLLYLDDYLGNEQKGIIDTLAGKSAIHKLSSYYGFGFMSYADIVRDFVYSDTTEQWFSPIEWPERQIHHTAGGHVAIMWVVAYNMLNIATVYCDSLKIGPEHIYEAIEGLPELRYPEREIKGEPLPQPKGILPPELNANLTLDNISKIWHHMENNNAIASDFNESTCPSSTDNENSRQALCTLRMFWALKEQDEITLIEQIAPFLVENDGWEEMDKDKTGLVPAKVDASLKLRFDNITDQIQALNFVAMKSYGEKWEGSRIKVDAVIDRKNGEASSKPMRSLEIEGVHDKHTSETYVYKIDFGEERALPGDVLNVHIQLVGGTTAKIMGMMFCRS